MKTYMFIFLLLVTGCASMSPEQINASSKAKDANVVCVYASGLWGEATTVYLNVDKGTVVEGGVTVGNSCSMTFATTNPVKQEKKQ